MWNHINILLSWQKLSHCTSYYSFLVKMLTNMFCCEDQLCSESASTFMPSTVYQGKCPFFRHSGKSSVEIFTWVNHHCSEMAWMYVYHYDDFMAGFDVRYVWGWFKINVVLKLVQGQRVSNVSVNLDFSNTYLSSAWYIICLMFCSPSGTTLHLPKSIRVNYFNRPELHKLF